LQAQQTLAFPRRSFSLAVAAVATVVAAALAIALVAETPRVVAPAVPAVVVVHLDQVHAAGERASEGTQPAAVVEHQDQTHTAQERASEGAGS
jgi:hypothetical protein